jgi:hypothetical protein
MFLSIYPVLTDPASGRPSTHWTSTVASPRSSSTRSSQETPAFESLPANYDTRLLRLESRTDQVETGLENLTLSTENGFERIKGDQHKTYERLAKLLDEARQNPSTKSSAHVRRDGKSKP